MAKENYYKMDTEQLDKKESETKIILCISLFAFLYFGFRGFTIFTRYSLYVKLSLFGADENNYKINIKKLLGRKQRFGTGIAKLV